MGVAFSSLLAALSLHGILLVADEHTFELEVYDLEGEYLEETVGSDCPGELPRDPWAQAGGSSAIRSRLH
jgi:hypothetical protein